MAKKIVINENDNVKIIGNVSKLVTYKSDGETCTWIPEDETRLVTKAIIKDGTYIAGDELGSPYGYSQVTINGVGNKVLGQLGEKSITKNGTYIAENDSAGPFYGYSRVVVDIKGGSSGDGGGGGGSTPVVGKDDDGDDAEVKTDDDGTIVVEKLPTKISISIYPNNLVYEDGQLIDFTGLKVKAFLPNDTEWGVVDDNELIKPVTVAEWDESSSQEEDSYATSSIVSGRIPFSSETVHTSHQDTSSYIRDTVTASSGNGVYICWQRDGSYINYVFASSDPSATTKTTTTTTLYYKNTGETTTSTSESESSVYTQFTNDNRTVYMYKLGASYGGYEQLVKPTSLGRTITNEDAWTVIYGDITPGYSGSQQIIPLQWKRPGDGKVLETSFTIAVHGSDDSGDSGGDNNTSGGNVTPGNQNIDVPQ